MNSIVGLTCSISAVFYLFRGRTEEGFLLLILARLWTMEDQ